MPFKYKKTPFSQKLAGAASDNSVIGNGVIIIRMLHFWKLFCLLSATVGRDGIGTGNDLMG